MEVEVVYSYGERVHLMPLIGMGESLFPFASIPINLGMVPRYTYQHSYNCVGMYLICPSANVPISTKSRYLWCINAIKTLSVCLGNCFCFFDRFVDLYVCGSSPFLCAPTTASSCRGWCSTWQWVQKVFLLRPIKGNAPTGRRVLF